MATLAAKQIKDTYKDLLQVSNSNAGVDTTLRSVEDGEGTTGALSMSTTVVGVLDGAVGAPGLTFKDDPDNGAYRIGANNWGLAVAGALALELDPIGAIQMPLQPAFLVRNSANDADVTGNDVTATVDFDTEVFDQNGDFSADTFTAPVAGRYLLTCMVSLGDIAAANAEGRLTFAVSNQNFLLDFSPANLEGTPTLARATVQNTIITDMDANDTVTVTIQIFDGTQIIDVIGNTSMQTSFSGCLLA